MKFILLTLAVLAAAPGLAAQAPDSGTVANSTQAHSTISLAVQPTLDDGRLVVKLAAQNSGAAPAQFGPASITLQTAGGQAIALMPLQRLENDVRVAAGMKAELAPGSAPTAGAYASEPMAVAANGQVDPSNYTGTSGISGAAIVQQSQERGRSARPTISKAQAAQQIATLKQAILQDSMVQPGQIAVGEIVSEPLKFKRGDDRTLHLWVRFAGDEHSFTIAAPEK